MPVTPRALKEPKPCPECGSTDRTQEPGQYTLQQAGGQEGAAVVRALVCGNCGYTALYRSA
jgi:predicted nucleic-acid-binding Zn-ribbon protein